MGSPVETVVERPRLRLLARDSAVKLDEDSWQRAFRKRIAVALSSNP
jgi:hypothetical protein